MSEELQFPHLWNGARSAAQGTALRARQLCAMRVLATPPGETVCTLPWDPCPEELPVPGNATCHPQGQGPGRSVQVTKITPAACGCVFQESLSRASQSSFRLSVGSFSSACQSDTNHARAPRTPKDCFHQAGWRPHYVKACLINVKWLELF